jgi:TusA-related sulfurtransferase
VVIRGTDRVADVLARDESLVDVFVAAAPAFARLRNPGMRRVMARLVTVEQAARVAGLDAALLLRHLNDAIGSTAADPAVESAASASAADPAGPQPPATPQHAEPQLHATPQHAEPQPHAAPQHAEPQSPAGLQPPAALAAVSPDRVIELDVREDLRNGQEPFSRIMAARRALAPDGALCLRAIFEPVPLYDVFAKQGLAHWTDRLGDDDWMVWFYSAQLDPAASQAAEGAGTGAVPGAAHAGPGDAPSTAADPVILDVRGLEPPEPMQRTLEALADLPPGGTLIQLNVRVPQMLLPQLDARGCTYVVHTEADDRVRVVIHAPAVPTQPSSEQAIS